MFGITPVFRSDIHLASRERVRGKNVSLSEERRKKEEEGGERVRKTQT